MSADGYVQLQRAVKIDPDFIKLTPAGQWLYFQLLLDVNHIGVADWRPKRLMDRAELATMDYVMAAALDLVENHFAVIDTHSEEILVRTYMKHDGAHKQPNTCTSMVNAFGRVGSPTLRAVITHELIKIWDGIERGLAAGNPSKPDIVAALRKRWNILETILGHPQIDAAEAYEVLLAKGRAVTAESMHAA